MISYKILTEPIEKNSLKEEFQIFFNSVFDQNLADSIWQHQIINSPYSNSPLFLAFKENKIIGSALMILQKIIVEGKEYRYYLFTTSAIEKKYRNQGVYAELLKIQKEYAKNKNIDFIFVYPNKIAYQVLKLFGGFKDLQKDNLVQTVFENLNTSHNQNSLLIDNKMFSWRFEHKDYKYCLHKHNIIIYKKFENSYDIMAIYSKNDFKHHVTYSDISKENTIITLQKNIKHTNGIEKINQIKSVYFPLNKDINYAAIDINLLMSDVF